MRKKIYIIVGIVICLVIVSGIIINYILKAHMSQSAIDEKVTNIENELTANNSISNSDMKDIQRFIKIYKDNTSIKGEFVNYLKQQADERIAPGKNSENLVFYLNTVQINTMLYDIYPNDSRIKAISTDLKDWSNTDSTSSNFNNLTSTDGNLELTNENSDGYNIKGNIKNLSDTTQNIKFLFNM